MSLTVSAKQSWNPEWVSGRSPRPPRQTRRVVSSHGQYPAIGTRHKIKANPPAPLAGRELPLGLVEFKLLLASAQKQL